MYYHRNVSAVLKGVSAGTVSSVWTSSSKTSGLFPQDDNIVARRLGSLRVLVDNNREILVKKITILIIQKQFNIKHL